MVVASGIGFIPHSFGVQHVQIRLGIRDQAGDVWVNFITTEPCSPEPWKSMGFYMGNHPLLWPNYSD